MIILRKKRCSMNDLAQIQLAIVDDNIFLAKAIEKKIVQAADLVQVLYVSEGHQLILSKLESGIIPDIILMDIEMPEMDGIALTRLIKDKWPEIKIIMLTVFDHEEKIFEAIQAGASGYLLKDVTAENLIRSLQETYQGGASITPSIAFKILRKLKNNPIGRASIQTSKPILTQREIEVLERLKTGKTYLKIAQSLDLSEGTIRKHIENIYKKLQAHNKLEALEKAKKLNIIIYCFNCLLCLSQLIYLK